MAQSRRMQQLRHVGGVQVPATLTAGELAYNQIDAAGAAAEPGDLYIGDGTAVKLLVGPSKHWTTASFKLDGGTNGHILRTDGAGNVSWTAAPTGGLTTVHVNAPLTGDGIAAGTALSLSVAAAGDVTAGTNNVLPVTSLTLHGVTGTLSALDTTHKTSLVGAINEVLADLASATAGGLSAVAVASPLIGTGTGAIGSSANPVGLTTVPINLGGTNGTTALAALDNLTGGSASVTGVPHRTAAAWVVGPVPVADGGTGATTAAGGLDALSGASGATTGHLSRSAGGVWSVDTATYLTTVNATSPLTGSGTAGSALTLGTVPINLGGTNGTTALAALDNLTGGSAVVTGVPHRTASAWVVGPVPVADGGTGATTAAGGLDALAGASGATTGHLSRSSAGVWSVDTATYMTSVNVSAPITGNGVGTALGLTIASAGDVTTGTDNTNPVSSLRLREVTGALTGLSAGITNTSLVAAINSIHTQVTALSNPLRFAGTYNSTTHLVEAGGLHPAGALQTPSAANEGWVLIVGTGGTGAAPAPVTPLTLGDWLVSSGAGGAWVHIDLDLSHVAAANVSVSTITGAPAGTDNVQTALTNIYTSTGGNISVLTDGTSITGTGRTGAALEVGTVDAGTY